MSEVGRSEWDWSAKGGRLCSRVEKERDERKVGANCDGRCGFQGTCTVEMCTQEELRRTVTALARDAER